MNARYEAALKQSKHSARSLPECDAERMAFKMGAVTALESVAWTPGGLNDGPRFVGGGKTLADALAELDDASTEKGA